MTTTSTHRNKAAHRGGQAPLLLGDVPRDSTPLALVRAVVRRPRDCRARRGDLCRSPILVVPFRCLLGTCMFTCRRKEPPPSAYLFNKFWDIA